MADLNKLESRIAVKTEVTEGTYVAPTAATDYVQPLEDGFEFAVTKDLVERSILTSALGEAKARTGIKRSTGSMPVEFRASGIEGAKTDFDLLLQGAFGTSRQSTSRVVTTTSHTTTLVNIANADIGDLNVGDGIIILEAGSHHIAVITAQVDTPGLGSLTFSPAASFTPSNGVELTKVTTYFTPASGATFPSLSITNYIGNGGVSQRIQGCRVGSLSLDSFTTGQIAAWNFALQGMGGSEVLESAPHTPTFDTGTPPLILRACVFRNGVELAVNNFAFSLTNNIAEKLNTCNANGVSGQRIITHEITGTFDPFKSDSSLALWNDFDNNTDYAIVVVARTASSVTGEIELGTALTLYFPQVVTVEKPLSDLDGIVQEAVSFRAHGGTSGTLRDIYHSVI